MKKIILTTISIILTKFCFGQYSGNFNVNGDLDKFYPVVFQDVSWSNNRATEIEIGRSSVHSDATWRGSVLAKFSFHATNWGKRIKFYKSRIISI